MAQEFTINSSTIEDKINQLLPSQGGFGAGVDFSASTMIIPIVDLTESAEGSGLRADLQVALDTASSSFSIANATNTVIINTAGFFRVFGRITQKQSGGVLTNNLNLFDGTSANSVWTLETVDTSAIGTIVSNFDFIVFLNSGVSLRGTSSANARLNGATRQIADLQGDLVNPSGFV